MKVSIIIPAHNEEDRIGIMLDAYLPYFAERYGREDIEITVVINGTSDNTESVVRERIGKYPFLKVIVEPKPVGKGGALMIGFEKAQGDLVGFVDADGATPPEAFQDLVDNVGDSDAVIASRWRKESKVSPKQPFIRRFVSRGFNLLTRVLFGLKLTDTQCGAKLMRRDAVRAILPHLGLTRWAFDVDLLFHLHSMKKSIKEIPTTWHDVAGSKISAVARTSFDMFVAIVRLRLLHSPFRWVVTVYNKTLGPIIQPEGMESDYLIRHSLLLLVGGQVSNILNIVFQVVMLRMLTDDYRVLSSMLGLFMIISAPMGAMSRTIAHFSAGFIKEGSREKIGPMVSSALRTVIIVGLPLLVIMFLLRGQLVTRFKLANPAPVVMTGVALVLTLLGPIFVGVLQGAQVFFWVSACGIVFSGARVLFAIAFVMFGFGATGALGGHAAAVLVGVIVGLFGIHCVMGRMELKPSRVSGFYAYFFPTMLALGGFAVLMYLDVVAVTNYFPEEDADIFTRAVTIARMVIFLPMPVAMAMFPKVVTSGDASSREGRILLKAVLLVALMVLGVAALCSTFPGFIIRVLTGGNPEPLLPILRGMVWALSPMSIVFLLMNFELAQRRFRIVAAVVLSAMAYGGAIVVWHNSLQQIVLVVAVTSCTALALSLLCLPWKELGWGDR